VILNESCLRECRKPRKASRFVLEIDAVLIYEALMISQVVRRRTNLRDLARNPSVNEGWKPECSLAAVYNNTSYAFDTIPIALGHSDNKMVELFKHRLMQFTVNYEDIRAGRDVEQATLSLIEIDKDSDP
jgi:hypothetical protein